MCAADSVWIVFGSRGARLIVLEEVVPVSLRRLLQYVAVDYLFLFWESRVNTPTPRALLALACSRQEEAREERHFTRRYIRRAWASNWCSMLGGNLFACVRDTSTGVLPVRRAFKRPLAPLPETTTPDHSAFVATAPFSGDGQGAGEVGGSPRPVASSVVPRATSIDPSFQPNSSFFSFYASRSTKRF